MQQVPGPCVVAGGERDKGMVADRHAVSKNASGGPSGLLGRPQLLVTPAVSGDPQQGEREAGGGAALRSGLAALAGLSLERGGRVESAREASMATFDETARHACKMEGTGLTSWLDRFAEEPMAGDFARWDDTPHLLAGRARTGR
jgi:hypothetical protein